MPEKVQKKKDQQRPLHAMLERLLVNFNKHARRVRLQLLCGVLSELYGRAQVAQHSADHTQQTQPESAACQVCYCDFDDDTVQVVASNCGHGMICVACFRQYLSLRVRDEDVMPYIPCPDSTCKAPLSVQDLTAPGALSLAELRELLCIHLHKLLCREEDWVECIRRGCRFGFWQRVSQDGTKLKCKSCHFRQFVRRKNVIEEDEGLKKMLQEGTLRLCPKCENPHMKEYGLCNVMHCSKCDVWWNWNTRDTGGSMQEVKQTSRTTGTLWEPGELNYQMTLQHTDLPKFIALLERNGITYDPNYRRGSS